MLGVDTDGGIYRCRTVVELRRSPRALLAMGHVERGVPGHEERVARMPPSVAAPHAPRSRGSRGAGACAPGRGRGDHRPDTGGSSFFFFLRGRSTAPSGSCGSQRRGPRGETSASFVRSRASSMKRAWLRTGGSSPASTRV